MLRQELPRMIELIEKTIRAGRTVLRDVESDGIEIRKGPAGRFRPRYYGVAAVYASFDFVAEPALYRSMNAPMASDLF